MSKSTIESQGRMTKGGHSINGATVAAEAIACNQDLLTQILICLPPKSLIRFKSVSKSWFSLISDPSFCHRHSLRPPTCKLSGIILRRTLSRFEFVSLGGNHSVSTFTALNFTPSTIKILQSCNGLLLCSSDAKCFVTNPTTKHFSMLPDFNCGGSFAIFGFNLAFDLTKSPNYIVVCVGSTVKSHYHYQIMIYSSDSRNQGWRVSGSPFVAPQDIAFDKGVYWNGGMQWISRSGSGMSLCFDVMGECVRQMPGLGRDFEGYLTYFGESSGHLHLVKMYGSYNAAQLRVFELERDYSRWSFRCQIDLVELTAAFPEMVRGRSYAFIVLPLLEDEEGLSMLLHIPEKLISYRFKDKTTKRLCDLIPNRKRRHSHLSLQFGWSDAYLFYETLASV